MTSTFSTRPAAATPATGTSPVPLPVATAAVAEDCPGSTAAVSAATVASAKNLTTEECVNYVRSLRVLQQGDSLALQVLSAGLAAAPLPTPWRLRRDSLGRAFFEDQVNLATT